MIKHCCKIKAEQVISLQMTQPLKSGNINVVPVQLFCRQCKARFCQKQTYCIDDQDKFQYVTDTDNEFTECQTPRKKPQLIGISYVSIQTIMSNISEAYKVQVDCL